MVLVFDLDDTLYPEISYVKSGFMAVAEWGEKELKLDKKSSYSEMLKILNEHGRGQVFDLWLKNKKHVKKAIQIYRRHKPDIKIYDEAKSILGMYSHSPLYIVTDGNKNVQSNKIKALCIASIFNKVYITHRYGLKNSKPSVYCFQLIKNREACEWRDIVYIGDNPNKDFVGIKKLGVKTVRVLTGCYKAQLVSREFDAETTINSLLHLEKVLEHEN
jgi:putative hydrolase of the HAD superfamily